MYEINNYELRNLQEQVLKNKEEIARHWDVDRVLADFGIQVQGRVDTKNDLPETEYTNFGYAYLVGTTEPYTVYVWTRANPNVGEDYPYWLNIGSLNIKGEKGDPGAYVTQISLDSNYFPTFTFSNGTTITIYQSIRGPQGERGLQGRQGIQGPQGSVGPRGEPGPEGPAGTFNIIGSYSNEGQLPLATTRTKGDAALVLDSTGSRFNFYVITGTSEEEYAWLNTGTLGAGTTIYSNGSIVSEWNADTKLNRVTSTSSNDRVYAVDTNGSQTMIPAPATGTVPNGLVRFNYNNRITSLNPVAGTDVANKTYVDTTVSDMGATKAPAGFGVGQTQANNIEDLDNPPGTGVFEYHGAYSTFSISSCVVVVDIAYGNYMRMTLTDFYNNTYCTRTKSEAGWNEWEWITAPMLAGIEYRTTDRINGEPIYIQLMDLGRPPADSAPHSVNLPAGVNNIISWSGYITYWGVPLPWSERSGINPWYVMPGTGSGKIFYQFDGDRSAGGNIYVLLKYTKR